MAKVTKSQLTTMKREEELARLVEFLTGEGEDVMREAGNAIVFPSTNAEGDEIFVKITVTIPRGDRSGEAYDGYTAAQDYALHLEEKAAAAQKRKERAEAAKAKKEAEEARRDAVLAKAKQEEGE